MKFSQFLIAVVCLLALSTILSSTNAANSAAVLLKSPGIIDAANMLYYGMDEKQKIQLKDGQWTGAPFVDGGASRPSAGLIKNFTFSGDIDGNGAEERVVFLWQSSGGSGTRVYMAIIGIREDKLVNLATYLLGDRVQLQMGRIYQGKIELDVIQSGKGDAACCPTNKILRTWSMSSNQKNNYLQENKAQFLGRISLDDLEGVEWLLTKMNGSQPIPENIKITMIVDNAKVSGRSGCNRYFAGIKEGKKPNDIVIARPAGTRMACHGGVMELEALFLKALSNVNKFSFVNGQLAFSWKDDNEISTMLFTSQPIKPGY